MKPQLLRRRLVGLPLLLAAGAAAGAPPAGVAKGIDAGELDRLDAPALARRMDRLRDLGVQWLRLTFDWSHVQPDAPDRYHWDGYDRVVQASADSGIALLGIVAYTPAWANGGHASKVHPPADPAAFARFAGALAARYPAARVAAWEIWNEPNLGDFWHPAADAGAYAELLRATAAAIRAASPSAIVVSGGLAQPVASDRDIDAREFLHRLYQLGAGASFDAVGNHPYTTPHLASGLRGTNWMKMHLLYPSLRGIMEAHGDRAKPIWITEFGAPTGGRSRHDIVVDEVRQAEMLRDVVELARRQRWTGPVFWYALDDYCPPDPQRSTECYYGLLRHDGTPKPAYAAFRELPRAVAP